MQKLRAEKGITLIALVITIIVMLILVGVTINIAINGGLFNYEGGAVDETRNALNEEQLLENEKIEIGGKLYESIDDYINNNTIIEFSYYADTQGAMAEINDGTIGQNQTAIKEDASVGVYIDENGKANIILLKDTSTSKRITPTTDVIINLNGKTLTCTNLIAIDTSADYPVAITIDGRTTGSKIQTVQSGTNQARAIQVRTGSTVDVLGGTYSATSSSGAVCTIFTMDSTTLNISDAVILGETSSAAVKGISINGGEASANISDCDITTKTKNSTCDGIFNYGGEATVSNCTVKTYSNINTSFTAASVGINNQEGGELSIKDCYVLGTHSAVQSAGDLNVDGGTYESFAHGGFYIAGANTTAYIKNVISRECPMPDGYTHNYTNPNGGGMYVGGAKGMDNISVYLDNCELYGSKHPIVLRDTAGEKNNSVYISNSEINTENKIRIDNDTHKVYIGVGNNFTADDTTLPSAVVETNETYIFE